MQVYTYFAVKEINVVKIFKPFHYDLERTLVTISYTDYMFTRT